MTIDRRSLLKAAGAASLIGAAPRALGCRTRNQRKGGLHAAHRHRAGRAGAGPHRLDHALQRPVSGPAAALQGRTAGRRRYLQRHRHAGTGALARPDDSERRRRRRGGRHALRPGARHAPHRLRAEDRGLPLLSHACRGRRRSQPRHLHRPGGAGLHRAEEQSRRLRPRSLPGAEGVRAVLQPRRRHGDGRAGRRADQGAARDRREGRTKKRKGSPRATKSATSCSASTAGCSATASRSA